VPPGEEIVLDLCWTLCVKVGGVKDGVREGGVSEGGREVKLTREMRACM